MSKSSLDTLCISLSGSSWPCWHFSICLQDTSAESSNSQPCCIPIYPSFPASRSAVHPRWYRARHHRIASRNSTFACSIARKVVSAALAGMPWMRVTIVFNQSQMHDQQHEWPISDVTQSSLWFSAQTVHACDGEDTWCFFELPVVL